MMPNNMEEMLKKIERDCCEWIALNRIDKEVVIAENVQVISCDTRDFALSWSFKQPEPYKKANCNYEFWANEGLQMIQRLKQEGGLEEYLIEPNEIVSWLVDVCQKSGGFEEDWRFLTAKVERCSDWQIKYIRFVRHGSLFIVCNSYMQPIQWRLVIDNIYDPIHENDAIDVKDIEKHSSELETTTAHTIQNTWFCSYNDKPKDAMYKGPCCKRCRNRFKKSGYCTKHQSDSNCYRFKLEK